MLLAWYPSLAWSRADEQTIVVSWPATTGAGVKPSRGGLDDRPTRDNPTREQTEQREARVRIPEMEQTGIVADNFCDAAGFLDRLDGEDDD